MHTLQVACKKIILLLKQKSKLFKFRYLNYIVLSLYFFIIYIL